MMQCVVPRAKEDSDDGFSHEGEGSKVENKLEAEDDERAADPFEIPPSKLTKLTFDIQNPFITVIDDSVRIIEQMEDKVCDGKVMDNNALKEAMSELVGAAKLTSCTFKTPSSEIGGRPHHNVLAQAFWLITRPHEKPVYASIKEYKKAMSAKGVVATTSASTDNQFDLQITQKKVDLTGNESNESLDARQEGDDGEAAKGARIMNFVVHDRNIPGPDKKVTTLIVDGTWVNLTLSKMFQVSSYGCKYAFKNMEKGRFSPLYVELWGESKWRYGILYPSGVVLLDDGKISATRFQCSSMGELENMLREKEKSLDDNFPRFKGRYPDGCYVEGILYLSGEKFTLPNCLDDHQLGHIQDAQLFFQSKMRIIAGDTVLQWKEDDVKGRVAFRRALLDGHKTVDDAWTPVWPYKRRRT